ncbi:hypothetical protein CLV70_1351 [Pseudosporangium ferrugineum]|uniref:O-antigen ligase-related domain-containing protein n=1 Tax=Pseudosporangium ferrugineum TaxID=439699 RepID=A0A2T0RDQ3_9ACTN|nr:hypothetical protein CLV70_1351 [Pseudosporangium ferrugineum]
MSGAAASVTATLIWPTPTAIGISSALGLVALAWLGRRGHSNSWSKWPVHLLPLHLAALLAPSNSGLLLIPLAFVLARRWPRLGAVDVLAVAFTAWATYCDTRHFPGPAGSQFYWLLCLLLLATRHLITNVREFVSVCIAYIAGCIYVAVPVIAQAPASTGADWRPTSNVNINYTAYVLLTGIVLTIAVGALVQPHGKIRIAQVIAALILAAGIWATGTRAALLGLGAGIAFTLTRKLTASRTGWLLIATGFVPVALLSVALGWYGDAQLPELERFFNRQTGDLSGRLDVWPYARAIWESAELTGVGMNHFRAMNPLGIGSHNIVLTLGVDFGWIGVILYASMVGAAMAGFGRHVRCRRLGGLLLLSWVLIWATGHWEAASAAWLVLGLWSRLPELVDSLPRPTAPFSSVSRGEPEKLLHPTAAIV